MRQIGSVDSGDLASRFVDYLKTMEISAQSEEDEGRWIVWVKDENQVDQAREALTEFTENPNATQYLDAPRRAQEIRSAEIQKHLEAKKNLHSVRGNWSGPLAKRAPVVFGLIVICVVVGILGGSVGGMTLTKRLLLFADPANINWADDPFVSIRQGQVWRLITPIFLHAEWTGLFGILHIVFNLYWMNHLGGQVESKLGAGRFLGFVVVAAVLPNVLQALVYGAFFVGISGVVYALFAYAWLRRGDGYFISQQTMFIVMLWFLLGFAQSSGHAVGAHAGGLIVGAILAQIPQSSRRKN